MSKLHKLNTLQTVFFFNVETHFKYFDQTLYKKLTCRPVHSYIFIRKKIKKFTRVFTAGKPQTVDA